MAGIFDSLQYTPQEIAAMKSRIDAAEPYQAGMGLGLNVAQNLSPSAGLGFVLGNILGSRLNNYLDEQRAIKAQQLQDDYQSRWKNYLTPQNSQLLNFPQNQYNFENWRQLPTQNWSPPRNNLLNLRW